MTALDVACRLDELDLVNALLEAGAILPGCNNKESCREICQVLCSIQSHTSYYTYEHWSRPSQPYSPLMIATINESSLLTTKILQTEAGIASINYSVDGMTGCILLYNTNIVALHLSAEHKNTDFLEKLVETGAHSNSQPSPLWHYFHHKGSLLPLSIISSETFEKFVSLLLKSGSTVNDHDSKGWSCVHYLAALGEKQQFEYLKNLYSSCN